LFVGLMAMMFKLLWLMRIKMKKIRNFKCAECKEVTERMVEDDVMVINCICEGFASRLLSSPKCFSNTVGRSPSAR